MTLHIYSFFCILFAHSSNFICFALRITGSSSSAYRKTSETREIHALVFINNTVFSDLKWTAFPYMCCILISS